MRRRWLAVIVLVAAGCGRPAESRLSKGTEVVLYSENDATVLVKRKDRPGDNLLIPMGTRVVVVDDSDQADKYDRESTSRKVEINIMEGEHQGVAGTTSRNQLRPK